jgi:Flp pilus assembly protein TadD
MAQGEFNLSLKAFDKAIALDPNESSYYSAKAKVLTSLGRKEEAL